MPDPSGDTARLLLLMWLLIQGEGPRTKLVFIKEETSEISRQLKLHESCKNSQVLNYASVDP